MGYNHAGILLTVSIFITQGLCKMEQRMYKQFFYLKELQFRQLIFYWDPSMQSNQAYMELYVRGFLPNRQNEGVLLFAIILDFKSSCRGFNRVSYAVCNKKIYLDTKRLLIRFRRTTHLFMVVVSLCSKSCSLATYWWMTIIFASSEAGGVQVITYESWHTYHVYLIFKGALCKRQVTTSGSLLTGKCPVCRQTQILLHRPKCVSRGSWHYRI